ncbi:MAG: AAA family ATPase [bacterium]
MTVTIAVTGKSGSGKTAFTHSLFTALRNEYHEKSVLLVDNTLGCDLASIFGLEVNNTIHSIRTGQYVYSSPIHEGIKKSELIEWMLHEIIINLSGDADLLVSGPVFTEECTCVIARYIKDAMKKLIKSYDIVIIDCEYDLSYVNQLVNYYPDVTIVLAEPTVTSVHSAIKIRESSMKYASPGQIGVVLNKVKDSRIPEDIKAIMMEYDFDILGVLPYAEELETEDITHSSDSLGHSAQELIFRLNLPFWGN